MKVVGLVAAKENSNRFPNKNIYTVNGVPMFMNSVQPLLDSTKVDDVYVITDSNFIKSYCHQHNIRVIWRPKNATRDEDKLITILRYGYYSLDVEYDTIVSLMANCPGNSTSDINTALHIKNKNNLKEVRGFDKNGVENGLIVLDKEIIQSNRDISYYLGGLVTRGSEIHSKGDLKRYKLKKYYENK